MRASARRTALCGLLAAVSVVCLMMGSLIPAALYACPILAMAALLPLREQFGHSPALTTYAAVSILALLLVPDKELALLYVFFGWYVPLQPFLDRLHPRPLRCRNIDDVVADKYNRKSAVKPLGQRKNLGGTLVAVIGHRLYPDLVDGGKRHFGGREKC